MLVRSLLSATVLCVYAGCSGDGGATEVDTGAPVFTTSPVTTADHNRPWSYTFSVMDPDGDPVTLDVIEVPAWVDYDSAAATFSGLADWENIGSHRFRMTASDGLNTAFHAWTLQVARGEIICQSDFGDPAESAYVLPFRGGETYRLIQGYCPTNPNWGHHNWFAYDFDTQNGDTIVASRAGDVIFVREDRPNVGGVCGQGMENFVFIEHEDGTVMQYVHFDTDGALVSVGETVQQGQPIGLSGNSGCSSGPHVHVALFRNRTNFDRQSTLPVNYANAQGPVDARGGLVQSASYTAGGG